MAPSHSAADAGTPRVADHFPRKPKQCVSQAEKFFACFSTKGDQPEGTADKEAGRRGLAECAREMAAYDTCMTKFFAKKKGEQEKWFFRVQEEYRLSHLKGGEGGAGGGGKEK